VTLRAGESERWQALLASVTRWVTCRTRPPIDPRDIASEVVVRGIAALGASCALAWPALLAWGITAAGRLLIDGSRRSERVGFELRGDLDGLSKPAEVEGGGSTSCCAR
jgi:DNA-directed RNA polymerase specialized sigma24 family protein